MPHAIQDYATLPLPLTTVEAEALHEYEGTIARGLTTFYEVGAALMAIKTQKLYRAEYRTFEAYCAERWHIGRSRAYQLIEAAGIKENLSTTVDILPANESQARALSGLEPDQQRQVWQKAVDTAPGGNVTAQHIQNVRQVEIPMPAPKPQQPVAAPVQQVSVFVPQEHPRPIYGPCAKCGKQLTGPGHSWFDSKHHDTERICDACESEYAKAYQAEAQDTDKAFHFMHQDRARICAAGLTVLRVDLYKRIIYSYDPQQGGTWKLRLKCKNDGEMMDAISRISDEPNTIFENRV